MAQSQNSPPEPPAVRLMQCITGHWVAAAVHTFAKLKLADAMQGAERSSDELADAVGAHGPSVYRLLRAVAGLGLCEEIASGSGSPSPSKKFRLTEMGQLLQSDHAQSLRSMALFQGAPAHWKGWGDFLYAVRTGQSSFEHVNGQGFFDYCQSDPEFSAAFNGAMTGMSASAVEAVLQAYDFSGMKKLVDVGGGHGLLISRILARYPNLRGGIADLPHVVAGAGPLLTAAGVADRCELTGTSFFDSVPPADGYIAKNILHDWDDEHAIKILKSMRAAMTGAGKVLLVELVIQPDGRQPMVILLDLEMLQATHGGRERTQAEFAALFQAAGFRLDRVVETRSMLSVLEASPA